MEKIMHFKEDTSKPENRVNITLFHLLMVPQVKEFIIKRFSLPNHCIIYPAPNLETEEFDVQDRPDYKVVLNGKIVGYIEVELGKDVEQVEKYKRLSKDGVEVYSIFGKTSDGGDLSLEELYSHLKGLKNEISELSQSYWSIELLERLIKYYVIDGNFNSSSKRTAISEKMRSSHIISYLYQYFGEDKIKDGGAAETGMILLNTVGEGGFSLRIYNRKASAKSFSLMNRTGGSDRIYFPSFLKIDHYLDNKEFVSKYVDMLIDLGCSDIKNINEKQKTSLDIKSVETNMGKLCDLIRQVL